MMDSPRLRDRERGHRGFTLVELLVVITIIALISAVALPVVLPALSERRVSEAAREFQAGLVGIRDAAIRANAPRGIRLLPDPVLSPAPYGNGAPGVLASNRFVTIEPAPDYSEGMIIAITTTASSPTFLQVAQAAFSSSIPNEPTGWAYNVRQGDKIRFNDSGAYYTVAGPMQLGPSHTGGSAYSNSERYINDARANNLVTLGLANCINEGIPFASYVGPGNQTLYYGFDYTNHVVDYLNLVNGVDDDNDGWIDEGFDGIDNDGDGITDPGYNGVDDNGNGTIDEPAELLIGNEFEQETFAGDPPSTSTPTAYTIFRRPIVSPGSREVSLPDGIVVDMTTYNASSATPASFVAPTQQNPNGLPIQLPERSRVPVDPYTYYVDIMIAPSGQVVQAGAGSAGIDNNSNSSPTSNMPFYHFWLTEREGVVAPLWGVSAAPRSIPSLNPNYPTLTYLLPMPQGTTNLTVSGSNVVGSLTYSGTPLTGERRLVTVFTRSGQVVTNSIEIFDLVNTNRPFYDAQSGIKEQQ